ncbi:MAG: 4-phosphoerythronate dehydrogenase [Idiomarina sp.]
MNILADANIPQVEKLFESFGKVSLFSSRQPAPEQLAQAQVLLVRSVTQVNQALLQRAPELTFVGTATIGVEHIDQVALQQRNIQFASAPGANAAAVGNYVLSATVEMLLAQGKRELPTGNAVIIGAGHTGTAAGTRLTGLGYQVSYYDPPLLADNNAARPAGCDLHADWQRVLEADLISCHVPLHNEGQYPTRHLWRADSLQQLKSDCLFINASRGPVVAEQDLRQTLAHHGPTVTLDVWEHEPQLTSELVAQVALATPHIAGHSLEGKVGGAYSLYCAFCKMQKRPVALSLQALLPKTKLPVIEIPVPPDLQTLATWLRAIYDIRNDDKLLRDSDLTAAAFDNLRKNYQVRRELSVQSVTGELLEGDSKTARQWRQRFELMGFHVQTTQSK